MSSKMDQQDNPIEGFARRPKRPEPIILPGIIEISDEGSGGEVSVILPPKENLDFVKTEPTGTTTASEISIPDNMIDEKKIKKKIKKKRLKKFIKKLLLKDESSSSDSDSSYDKRSESSSSSSSSNSGSDSSDRGRRRKRTHHRSKKPRHGDKNRHKSSKRNRKTQKIRNSKRLKHEKETTDDTNSSKSQSPPFMHSKNEPNHSNQANNDNSFVMDVDVNASIQHHPWHECSQYDSSMPVTPTQLVTVSTAATANGNGHDTQTSDQIVPLARYVDDGEVAGTSGISQRSLDETEEIMQFVADVQDIEQNLISDPIEVVHGSELASDQNNLLQLISSSENDTEQQLEINVGCAVGQRQLPAINLQRPRPNTDKMLYLTNPERAHVCVFCYDSYTNIVNHYKKKHSTEEVYVSRISPKMAKRLRGDNFERFEAKCEKKGSIWMLRAKCFFCEFSRTFTLSYWLDHIRVHTGEYSRQCTSCGTSVMSQDHCRSATDLLRQPHNLASSDLMCFMCKSCNFVQLEQTKMLEHLTKQHGFQENELKSKYDEKMLLPSKITVCREEVAAVIAKEVNRLAETDQQGNARNIRVNPFHNGAAEPEQHATISPEPNTPAPPNASEPIEPTHLEGKREFGWKQRLEDIYPNYITNADSGFIVNPWLESNICKTNIFPANLFDFYKCMHPNCIFSTNERTIMQDHIQDHYTHIDIGLLKGDPIDIHKMCRKCPYCYLGPYKSAPELFVHMETVHSSCTYQCSHCFYRCIEMDSIVLHYKKFHPIGEKNIYVVNNDRKFGLDQMERMSDVESEKPTQYREFECSYCDFESSQVDEIRDHLAEHHSSEFMFVLRRAEKNIYIYVGARSEWKNFNFFKCGKYSAMSKYLDLDQQNSCDQPNPFPLEPILRSNFEFEPSKLQIAEDVKMSSFVYVNYSEYRKSQTILFRCGQVTPEYLINNPEKRGSLCAICGIYVGKVDFRRHFENHQKTHCYFTAEREDLILKHMQTKHPNKPIYYTRCERNKNSSARNERSIRCLLTCANCREKGYLCLKKARDHHKVSHKTDVEIFRIDRYLDNNKITSEETFSFKAFRFCLEPNVDGLIGAKNCSVPMTQDALKQHHQEYHPTSGTQRYSRKLVLCKNDEIFPKMQCQIE